MNSYPPPAAAPNPIPSMAMLPLRLFFGIIFFFAGLDKLTDPTFFDPSNGNYIGKQLQGFVDYNHSPLSFLLTSIAIPNAKLFGAMIAIAEISVALLVLLGLFTRAAAFVGLMISTTLWLTASWGQTPFYTGWDLPYMFGWLTLLLAGPGAYALDTLMAARGRQVVALSAERRNFLTQVGTVLGAIVAIGVAGGVALTGFASRNQSAGGDTGSGANPSPTPVPRPTSTRVAQAVPTATPIPAITDTPALAATDTPEPIPTDTPAPLPSSTPHNEISGGNINTPSPVQPPTSSPRPHPSNTPHPQPTNTPPSPLTNTPRPPATNTPRPAPTNTPRPAPPNTPDTSGGRIEPNSTPPGGPTDTPIVAPTVPTGGVVIAKIADVPTGSGIRFTNPDTQGDAFVVHLDSGSFVGFDATCTHAGCAVNYSANDKLFICPCHGSEYDPAKNGVVVRPPARRPLLKINIRVDESSGNIYYVSS